MLLLFMSLVMKKKRRRQRLLTFYVCFEPRSPQTLRAPKNCQFGDGARDGTARGSIYDGTVRDSTS